MRDRSIAPDSLVDLVAHPGWVARTSLRRGADRNCRPATIEAIPSPGEQIGCGRPRGSALYKGIEGARGWLAWTVVGAHLVALTPLVYLPFLPVLLSMATWAVEVFIVISGFVITHIVIEKREPYKAYLARRALRIFPAYLVALAIGVAVVGTYAELIRSFPMEPPHALHRGLAALHADRPPHQLFLDLMLLQGLTVQTQFGYLPTAWSLSLEWQYYLVAPLFVAATRRRPVPSCIAVLAALAAFEAGLFGSFARPTILFGAGWLFLIGTLSRVWFDKLPAFGNYPVPLIVVAVPLLFASLDLAPVFVWIALIAYVRSDASWGVLDGRLARYMGARSYAIYILHYPIVLLVAWLSWEVMGLPTRQALLATCLGTGLAVLAGAELVHRWVELPAIRIGKRLGREPAPATQGW